MLTIEKLKEFGADTEDGLRRCMNMADFYLVLVKSVLDDGKLCELEEALSRGDDRRAFECAHSLKGVCANLSLTPLSKPVSEITEILRAGSKADLSGLLDKAKSEFEKLKTLAEE